MAASSVSTTPGRAGAPARIQSHVGLASAAPYLGVATISAVQAWEWLFSGLTKLQNGAFVQGFVAFVSHRPGPYGQFMKGLAAGLPGLLPRFVEATELGLGIVLIVAAVLAIGATGRVRSLAILAAGAASLVGLVTATNIAIIAGDRAPWKIGMSPFASGIPVETLLAAISLAGVATAFSAWRVSPR
jgi:hypothetical protein